MADRGPTMSVGNLPFVSTELVEYLETIFPGRHPDVLSMPQPEQAILHVAAEQGRREVMNRLRSMHESHHPNHTRAPKEPKRGQPRAATSSWGPAGAPP